MDPTGNKKLLDLVCRIYFLLCLSCIGLVVLKLSKYMFRTSSGYLPIGTSSGKSSYSYKFQEIVLLVQVLENHPIGTSSGKSSYWCQFWKIILLVLVMENHPIGTSSEISSYWYQFWKIILLVPVLESHPISTSSGKSSYWYQF